MRIGNRLVTIAAYVALVIVGSALVSDRAVASTVVLYDNLVNASIDADSANTFGPDYNSFSTGSSAFLLDAVSVLVRGNAASGGTFNLSLYSDNASTPGAVFFDLGSYSDSVLNASLTAFAASFAPVALAANARYWVGLTTTDSSIEWSFDADNSGVGVANEFYATPKGVFSNADIFGGGEPYQMSVAGTPVAATPLPASLVLFATALGGLGLLGLRRKKNTTPAAAI